MTAAVMLGAEEAAGSVPSGQGEQEYMCRICFEETSEVGELLSPCSCIGARLLIVPGMLAATPHCPWLPRARRRPKWLRAAMTTSRVGDYRPDRLDRVEHVVSAGVICRPRGQRCRHVRGATATVSMEASVVMVAVGPAWRGWRQLSGRRSAPCAVLDSGDR